MKLVKQSDRTMAGRAMELGISAKSIGEWVRLSEESGDPISEDERIELLKHCRLVLTDSGGLQKEAYFFGKHCVTLRDQTEWTELVKSGVNILAGADTEKIIEAVSTMSTKESDFSVDLYGNGLASENIRKSIETRIG